ncbi:hypothetical protein N9067_03125 [Akkermansiaceae bacterium]|nr:hypothetical protein [Akkermansiaceae bacterium]
MSSPKVYLCPSCQSVIRSEKEASEGLTCGECNFTFGGAAQSAPAGEKTVIRKAAPAKSGGVVRDVMKQRSGPAPPADFVSAALPAKKFTEAAAEDAKGPGSRDEESILSDGTRQVKRRKKRRKEEKHKKLYLFLTACIGVIVGLFLLFQIKGDTEKKTAEDPQIVGMEPWKREFYRKHLKSINANFNGYHRSASLPAKQQFIDRSSEMAAKFTRFNQTHTIPSYQGPMRLRTQNILELQEEPLVLAVETLWTDVVGNLLEAVHVWDGKQWHLDWECYAPYSNVPWTLFRSGVGKQEGEFRLLMRQRKGSVTSETMTFLLYFPQQAGADTLEEIRKSKSPEIVIERRSELGEKLTALFEDNAKNQRPLGSILGSNDSDGMIRVGVSLAWERDSEGEKKMVIKDLTGISWYGSRIQEVIAAQAETAEEDPKSDLIEVAPDPSLSVDE